MSAVELLTEAARFGIRVELAGSDLDLWAPAAPPPELIERLRAGKAELIAHLRTSEAAVVAWLNRNPPPEQPDPSRCLFCGEPEAAGRPLLPILAGDGGHRWLHDVCVVLHWRRRLAEAAAVRGPV